MEPLVRASLAVRTLVRRGHGSLIACALAAYVVYGGAAGAMRISQLVALTVWGVLLVSRVSRKLRATQDVRIVVDIELGMLLAVGLEAALVRFDGGLSGPYAPAIYVLVALVAAFARPGAGIVVVLFLLALEAALRFVTLDEKDASGFTTHACFVGAFALLNLALLRAEVARIRATARARVEAQLVRIKEDARSYRLLGAGEANDGGEVHSDRLARASVEEIHQSVHYALDLLRRSLDLHTAVLLWLNDAGTHLRISELSSASDDIHDAPFASGDGVLGVVLAQRTLVSLHGLKPSTKVPYYVGPSPVRALMAIPVLEGETLRGVLAVDRLENEAFTPHEEEIAAQAARFCLRAIQNERVFLQLERAKVEQGKLYRAAQSLAAALSEKDVVEAGVKAAREIASFDLAAVTVFEEATKTHEVVAARSAEKEIDDLVGVRFSHNAGLVSMVVQNRCPLPYRGEYEAGRQIVLTKRLPWPAHPSLLVLPLLMHDRALGTLILGAKRRHAFGDAVRPTLEVLASHLAVSLSNARMVHKLETMATTDGLTGLLNKRAMLEEGAKKIAAAARFGRDLSMLVVDIDFFKKVNDTHGHDVGDLVIKGLGEVLKRQKRATDLVARFGGEEFIVLCEQTDEKGAMLLAERIREELGKTKFRTPGATLAVTCSVGVSSFPQAGASWETLFKAADEALYVSKRSGRDRCTAWRAQRRVASGEKR
jgi:diguanylate cyclase (GGDEF)-like protein